MRRRSEAKFRMPVDPSTSTISQPILLRSFHASGLLWAVLPCVKLRRRHAGNVMNYGRWNIRYGISEYLKWRWAGKLKSWQFWLKHVIDLYIETSIFVAFNSKKYIRGKNSSPCTNGAERDLCTFLQSIALFNKLYLCRLYSKIGLNPHDEEVYSNNITDQIKDITKTFQFDTILIWHWNGTALTLSAFCLASRLKDILAAFARPKILEHTT